MAVGTTSGSGRLAPVMREEERVTPLELFFDLFLVLAITQCTALMAHEPTWTGLAKGLLVLALMWWAWVGYAWLTSVIDPEEGVVRLVMFAAMAGLLIAAMAIPHAFGDTAMWFVVAYGVVRAAHIALFVLSSRDDARLRRSVVGLGGGTALGVGLLAIGALLDPTGQAVLWTIAAVLDGAEPFFFGSEGWKLVPGHFAERHGLIVLIALGESIVAIGVGAGELDTGVAVAAVLGVVAAGALWWAYFDVVAIVAAHNLGRRPEGRERNELARDSYSYLHYLMVAGIVLVALGLKKTIAHVGDELDVVPAFALTGGAAIYLLGHVTFRLRNIGTLSKQRLLTALLLFALVPVATAIPALATLGIATAMLCVLIAYEAIRFAERRAEIRHELAAEPPGP